MEQDETGVSGVSRGAYGVTPEGWLAMGVAVIPVAPRTKMPAVPWGTYQTLLPREADLGAWFGGPQPMGVGVVCGWRGLTVLDWDDLGEYAAWQRWALQHSRETYEVCTSTYRVQTRRGVHLYLFVGDRPRNGHFAGGDVRGAGGYVVTAPSVHATGFVYAARDPEAQILEVDTLSEILPLPPATPKQQTAPPSVYAGSALFPKGTIDAVKKGVPILTLLPGAVPSGAGGRWFKVCCPFHEDRKPSMYVDARDGLASCYAGCTPQALDVIGLYCKLHGDCSVSEALKALAPIA